jgi:hypothetical protein
VCVCVLMQLLVTYIKFLLIRVQILGWKTKLSDEGDERKQRTRNSPENNRGYFLKFYKIFKCFHASNN